MTLGIIGSAGRRDDADRISPNLYDDMLWKSVEVIELLRRRGQMVTRLVSGGAAFADHIAVSLFIDRTFHLNLSLHLPAAWDLERNRFCEDGSIANYYHEKFTAMMRKAKPQFNSLDEIGVCYRNPFCKVTVSSGFSARNTKVAREADVMLAFTFGNGPQIKEGGTYDTMRKFRFHHYSADIDDHCFHCDLNTLTLWPKASVVYMPDEACA